MKKNSFSKARLLACIMLLLVVLSTCNKNEKSVQPVTAPANARTGKFNLSTAGGHQDFYITCALTGLALEIGGTSLANGGTADQSTYLGTAPVTNANQKWKITDQGTGYYKLMNLGSGKYLEMPATGTQVIQDQSSTSDAQLWSITNIGPYAYSIINKQSGLALTDHGGSDADGSPITQEAYMSNNTQWWNFTIIADASYRDDDVVRFFQRTSGSEAFDGGSSIALSTGTSLWTSGDVYYNQLNAQGEFRCGQIFNYHNSMLVQPASQSWDPTQTVNVLSPNGVQLFHDSNSKDLIWPGCGIQVGTHVYEHGLEVPIGTLTASNQYLCDITAASTTTANPVNPLVISGMSGQTAILYSIGMVNPGDGYIYVYGAGGFFNASVFVARFPQANPVIWTFWNGSAWASAPTTASAAVVAQGPVNNNTIGYVNGKYVMIAMDYGFTCDQTSKNIYSYTSTSPTGPFTHKTTVYSLPDMKQGHVPVFYIPNIHSEFNNGQQELLITYCVNFYNTNDGKGDVCLAPCSNPDGTEDPNDYRLKGVRIPYSLIGL
jgi:hypothetical protein